MPRVPFALPRRNTKWSFVFLYLYRGESTKMPGSLSSVDLVTSPLFFFSENGLSTYLGNLEFTERLAQRDAIVQGAGGHYKKQLYEKQLCDQRTTDYLTAPRQEDRHSSEARTHPSICLVDDPGRAQAVTLTRLERSCGCAPSTAPR